LIRSTALSLLGLVVAPFVALSLAGQSPAKSLIPAKPLTIEAIYGHGPLIGTQPEGLAWSPDGKHLTFMQVGELSEIEPGSDDAYVIVNRSRLASFSGSSASETDATIASVTEWPVTFGRRIRLTCSSTQTAGCGSMTCTLARACRWLVRRGLGRRSQVFAGWRIDLLIREHGLAVVRLKDSGTPMTWWLPRQ